ncbi:esterase [Streptomyces sp. Ag82_O1-12]|uniref:alpha/beta fold hydrolase n=1 Tax=unclassified Streptomyces TaxID=2593676 RepID=UPI000BD58B30|nr:MULTISPECIES: alpha/beta hydrolase [unclassified Streptomyces]SMQ19979.1 esterase [Streptomyces sp. Ag82_O1-12]SOD48990.1 esterase [Streptomyces sp. Ag82_G6-1]
MTEPSAGIMFAEEAPLIARRTGQGSTAFVVLPGFLDDATVWTVFADLIAGAGIDVVQFEPAGVGGRVNASGPFTLRRMAEDAGAVVDSLGKPCVVLGQSMGAQVAELVAAPRGDAVQGLILLTPVPLAGTRLPDPDIAPFRALGGNPEAQRAVRSQLTMAPSAQTVDLQVSAGARIPPAVVSALADAWNDGDPAGEAPSRFQGPVLIVRGAGDGFVTDDLLQRVTPRFNEPATAVIDRAGHWPHTEQPKALAETVLPFVIQAAARATSRL